jgi:hypothetical protein
MHRSRFLRVLRGDRVGVNVRGWDEYYLKDWKSPAWLGA